MEQHFFGQVAQKAVLRYNNTYVIVRQQGETIWSLPGGRLNTDENLTEGLLRELQEELSVECSIESIISANVYHGKEHTPKIFIFYHASVVADQEIVINNEIEEISFITKKEDLENRPMWRNQREVIEQFLS